MSPKLLQHEQDILHKLSKPQLYDLDNRYNNALQTQLDLKYRKRIICHAKTNQKKTGVAPLVSGRANSEQELSGKGGAVHRDKRAISLQETYQSLMCMSLTVQHHTM